MCVNVPAVPHHAPPLPSQNSHPRWGKTGVRRFGSNKNWLLVLQNPNKTPHICVNASFTIFTGVVERLFPVVKSCVLAGEKQWFDVLKGFANVHAHLPCVFVFVLRVLKNVHFSWGFYSVFCLDAPSWLLFFWTTCSCLSASSFVLRFRCQCRAGMGSQTLVFPQRGSFFQRGNENEKKWWSRRTAGSRSEKQQPRRGVKAGNAIKTQLKLTFLKAQKTKTNKQKDAHVHLRTPPRRQTIVFPQRGRKFWQREKAEKKTLDDTRENHETRFYTYLWRFITFFVKTNAP